MRLSPSVTCTRPPRTILSARAAELATQQKDGKFDELVLVTPPGVIAGLKESLSNPTAKVVVKEVQKDLTKIPDHELTGASLELVMTLNTSAAGTRDARHKAEHDG
jgi:protein required for attachment to host cells